MTLEEHRVRSNALALPTKGRHAHHTLTGLPGYTRRVRLSSMRSGQSSMSEQNNMRLLVDGLHRRQESSRTEAIRKMTKNILRLTVVMTFLTLVVAAAAYGISRRPGGNRSE